MNSTTDLMVVDRCSHPSNDSTSAAGSGPAALAFANPGDRQQSGAPALTFVVPAL